MQSAVRTIAMLRWGAASLRIDSPPTLHHLQNDRGHKMAISMPLLCPSSPQQYPVWQYYEFAVTHEPLICCACCASSANIIGANIMMTQAKPRVFVDSDVLFAGAASPSEHGASLVVLRMAEITLIEAVVSEQAIVEVERNLEDYLSSALPTFR